MAQDNPGISPPSLLADELRELVDKDARCTSARKRALSLFLSPLSLGGTPIRREELHEHRRDLPA
jgi:hypothetical protein